MKRLLCIVSSMNTGGAETFLMKMFRSLDRSKYTMDFCVNSDNNFYKMEIEELGGKIIRIPSKSENLLKWYRGLKSVISDNKYKYVIRVSEHSLAALDLLVAKLGGAKYLIMRSSNSSSENKKSRFVHKLFFFLPRIIPTVKIAPSTEAAEYTWGKDCVKKGKVELLHNGLDLDSFKYSDEFREKLRKEFGIQDKTVIGHIGRFNEQKNHIFLLDVFVEISKIDNNTILLMIGDGQLIEEIKRQAINKGVYDKCIFAGVRSDVNELLSAMDVFVFPSKYEGMPNTVIEAQASGLPCIISNSITPEANVTGLVEFLSLNNSPKSWATRALEKKSILRQETFKQLIKQGYDINDVCERFVKMIFEH